MDTEEDLLTIGQLAAMAEVSCKTLRYYDKLGLISPIMTGYENGYRYYQKEQVSTILLIKQMQAMGASLVEIKSYLNQVGSRSVIEGCQSLLSKMEQEIRQQMRQLESQLDKIRKLQTECQTISDQVLKSGMKPLKRSRFQARKIIYKRYDGEYKKDIFRESYMNLMGALQKMDVGFDQIDPIPLVVMDYSDTSQVHLQIGYELKSDLVMEGFETDTIRAGEYLVLLQDGAYPDCSYDGYQQIHNKATSMGYQATGPYVIKFYINEALTGNHANYKSEIQIPIKKIKIRNKI